MIFWHEKLDVHQPALQCVADADELVTGPLVIPSFVIDPFVIGFLFVDPYFGKIDPFRCD